MRESYTKHIGNALCELAEDQSEWSQRTFGTDSERGPVGAICHLEKEAREAWDVAMSLRAAVVNPGEQGNIPAARDALATELADCFLLVLDAARRGGINPLNLLEAAKAKMEINKRRTWPKPETDKPVEHVKTEAEEPNEALAATYRAESRTTEDGKPEGTVESLQRCVSMLNTYAPDCFPANSKGQIHFARGMMESTADEIAAFLANQPRPPSECGCGYCAAPSCVAIREDAKSAM